MVISPIIFVVVTNIKEIGRPEQIFKEIIILIQQGHIRFRTFIMSINDFYFK